MKPGPVDYDKLASTYATGLARFPPWETLLNWLATTGFAALEQWTVERIFHPRRGADVFGDPFLQKSLHRSLSC